MKSLIMQIKCCNPGGRQFLITLVLAALIGSLGVSPKIAAADDGHDQRGGRYNGNAQHDGRGYHGDRGYRREYRRPDRFEQRAYYAPPPVYYAPPQSPGINLFFPLDFRR